MQQNSADAENAAQVLALDALGWIAGEGELLDVFTGSTGIGPDALTEAIEDPEMLGAVLDFLMMDDAWIVAFCDARGLPYDAPARARAALPGGAQVHWT